MESGSWSRTRDNQSKKGKIMLSVSKNNFSNEGRREADGEREKKKGEEEKKLTDHLSPTRTLVMIPHSLSHHHDSMTFQFLSML